jgi:hypothetical protein
MLNLRWSMARVSLLNAFDIEGNRRWTVLSDRNLMWLKAIRSIRADPRKCGTDSRARVLWHRRSGHP